MPVKAQNRTQDSILLTPDATLRFEGSDAPWTEELFHLGAARAADLPPAPAFWRHLAASCIRELCHAANPDAPSPDEADGVAALPLPEDAAAWLDTAPPMPGGEYLSSGSLAGVWSRLLAWCADGVRAAGGLAAFLEKEAPQWRQVGRVFFHLAENRLNENRPFVFLATYTTGFGRDGRLRHPPLSLAHKTQGDAANTTALRHLLQPVQRAAADIPWVGEMMESRAIFAPRAWLPAQAYRMLVTAPALEEAGIGVRLPDWWKKRPRPTVQVSLGTNDQAKLTAESLVSFDVGVSLGDEKLTPEEMERLLSMDGQGLVLFKGAWVEVDAERLKEALEHWKAAGAEARSGGMTFAQGMRLLAGMPDSPAAAAGATEQTVREWSRLELGPHARELLREARRAAEVRQEDMPDLRATLRPYQLEGVSWLRFLDRLGMGACLADDMGLGKTVQVLALLLAERETEHGGMPTLLVIPASLLANWKAEAEKFAPSLNLLVLHTSERALPKRFQPELFRDVDLVVTTYSQCQRLPWLGEVTWRRVILDEAQAIKNPGTKQSVMARRLKSARRVALTGTPIENRLTDLWSLFDFLNPGLLGSLDSFVRLTKQMQGKGGVGLGPLRRLTSRCILRRLKTDKAISASLPDKIETTVSCHLTKEQARLYQQVTARLEEDLKARMRGEAEAGRTMCILQAIGLLKQICNHPAQAGLAGESAMNWDPKLSGKFQTVGDICADIASRQERVLIFTQFREIMPALEDWLQRVFGRPGLVLHGSVPVKRRGALVDLFQQEDGPPFFLISLKAGGTGLNLTRASHVIHFDRWWNPAVEDQATDRAFRIGQKNNVLVHKCVTIGTVEERIDALIRSKRALADSVLDPAEVGISSLSDGEVLDLVRLDLRRALAEG